MSSIKRFYIFTGKGGVGKTALSLSFCKYLQAQGKKAELIYFKSSTVNSMSKSSPDPLQESGAHLGIRVHGLELFESAKEYVAKKMKSETIAKWVLKTPFFKALVNMVPGFSYLIYLGRALDMLNRDPELILILDSPSSGHAITMLESTHNFNEIFRSGLLFEDTQKMLSSMYAKDFMQVNIITIPTMMAVNEAIELKATIKKIADISTSIICNNSFYKMSGINSMKKPIFLEEKIKNEESVIHSLGEKIDSYVPHIPSLKLEKVVTEAMPTMKNLI